jgi:hypothetical protein
MSSRRCSVPAVRRSFAVLAVLLLSGCTSIGDFGRLQDPLRTDDIHAWVGQEAAASAGAPISLNNLTEEERTLRDLAFPLIEPPYDRVRWDAVVLEYGIQRQFRRDLWVYDVATYYANLAGPFHRSSGAPGCRARQAPRKQHAISLHRVAAGERSRHGADRRKFLDDRLGAAFADRALRELPVRARAPCGRRTGAGGG